MTRVIDETPTLFLIKSHDNMFLAITLLGFNGNSGILKDKFSFLYSFDNE